MRALQGHSGGNKVVPSLHDNVETPWNWIDYIYHVVSYHDYNSIVKPCLIAGGKDAKERQQAVFFTTVDPRTKHERVKGRYFTEQDGQCNRTQKNGSI